MRFTVFDFPDGLRENEKLPSTIITPTTKAFDGGHDEPLTADQIIGRTLLTGAQWREVSELALSLFARGREIAGARGLILVDTKYEFGFDAAGHIVLADEIHTPDSSRYWLEGSYRERFAAGTRRRRSTRISCGAGSLRVAIRTAIRYLKSRAKSSPKPPAFMSRCSRP